jgi:hypothetical protein
MLVRRVSKVVVHRSASGSICYGRLTVVTASAPPDTTDTLYTYATPLLLPLPISANMQTSGASSSAGYLSGLRRPHDSSTNNYRQFLNGCANACANGCTTVKEANGNTTDK